MHRGTSLFFRRQGGARRANEVARAERVLLVTAVKRSRGCCLSCFETVQLPRGSTLLLPSWYDLFHPFAPQEEQRGSPGCCMDTLPKEDGGGRGLCFQYDQFRFLDPRRPERTKVDAYYFGSGLHLLHMYPHWPEMDPMEPLRIQS